MAMYCAVLLILWLGEKTAVGLPAPLDTEGYLSKYGYLNFPNPSKKELSRALVKLQTLAEIPRTGKEDDATKALMMRPRCGVPDTPILTLEHSKKPGKELRKWPKTDLTYRIRSSTHDMSRKETRDIIRSAFKVWSDVTPLTFTMIRGDTDIVIDFARYDHGDGNWFDGKGREFAHAFPPPNGEIHFDEGERWIKRPSAEKYQAFNLFYVAVHEIGHVLGLDHSHDKKSIMYPFHKYFGLPRLFKLYQDDLANIQGLYGKSVF